MLLNRLIQSGGWRLPLVLLAVLIVAQFGKQAGLLALGQEIPPVSKIITGMMISTPVGLLFWTGLAWGVICLGQILAMVFSRTQVIEDKVISWRELVALYLLASLTHVVFTAVDLTGRWLTGTTLPVQFPFLRDPWSFLVTVDATISTVTFLLMTVWYTYGHIRHNQMEVATTERQTCEKSVW